MRTGFGTNFYVEARRVEQDEPIPPGALHSLDEGGTLKPIVNLDTIGKTPSQFSKERSFWVIQDMVEIDLDKHKNKG